MQNVADRVFIEARQQSIQLEQLAALDLEQNINGYLPPSWTARQVVDGYKDYVANGNTDESAYLNMRKAYSETCGKSNKVFSDVIASHIKRTEYDMSKTMFVADDMENQIRSALYRLNHFGFARLKFRVPMDIVERLKNRSSTR